MIHAQLHVPPTTSIFCHARSGETKQTSVNLYPEVPWKFSELDSMYLAHRSSPLMPQSNPPAGKPLLFHHTRDNGISKTKLPVLCQKCDNISAALCAHNYCSMHCRIATCLGASSKGEDPCAPPSEEHIVPHESFILEPGETQLASYKTFLAGFHPIFATFKDAALLCFPHHSQSSPVVSSLFNSCVRLVHSAITSGTLGCMFVLSNAHSWTPNTNCIYATVPPRKISVECSAEIFRW